MNPWLSTKFHLGSWRRDNQGNFLTYRELAVELVNYVKQMGFTHIELLRLLNILSMAHGVIKPQAILLQPVVTVRPNDFRYFVDACHQNDIGIILDWSPAHFLKMRLPLPVLTVAPCMSMKIRVKANTVTGVH